MTTNRPTPADGYRRYRGTVYETREARDRAMRADVKAELAQRPPGSQARLADELGTSWTQVGYAVAGRKTINPMLLDLAAAQLGLTTYDDIAWWVLTVADDAGDFDGDGEPTGTVSLPWVQDDLRRLAELLPVIPGLLDAAACGGDCDGARLLSEEQARANLAGIADEISSVTGRLAAVRDVLTAAAGS
jgi:hypothetical protein